MKQLTIEEKARRYDEVFSMAKEWYNNPNSSSIGKSYLYAVLPELKESEDERIRENIIATIHLYYGEPLEDEAKEMIAWLERRSQTFNKKDIDDAYLKGLCDAKHEIEKQGERKPADKAVPFDEFEGLTDFERTLAVICIGWIGEELGWKQYIKDNADVLLKIAVKKFNSIQDVPFEQKPTWSEEDNKIIEEIINDIECARAINYHAPKEGYEFRENWLKSLKERYTWRPSEEQMDALHYVTNFDYGGHKATLVSLYEQLKKLKG